MSRELRFGVFSMPAFRPSANWYLRHQQIIDLAEHIEELGFDEYWVGEHHSGGVESVPQPDTLLAMMAQATETLKLAFGTVNLPYYINEPFNVAERMAFLDHLSKGRVVYGYGGGSLPPDFAMFNVGDDMKDRMWEAMDVIETYLDAEEPTDYEGEFYSYEDHLVQVPPYQADRDSAVAGMTSLSTFTGAVERGHRPISNSMIPIEAPENPVAVPLRDTSEELDRAAVESGRDPEVVRDQWSIAREVYVAESKKQAIEDVLEGAREYYDYLFELGDGGLVNFVSKAEGQEWGREIDVPWLIENTPWIIGSPEDCVAQIKALYDEVGGFGTLLINHHDWGIPYSKWKQSYERFAEEVMPAFQENLRPRAHERAKATDSYGTEPEADPAAFDIGFDVD